MHPLVQCYLGATAEAVDTVDRMVGYVETSYEEISCLDTDFSIPETKVLVDLAMVPMKSRGSNMVLQVMKVGDTIFQDMSMVEEIDYQNYSKN